MHEIDTVTWLLTTSLDGHQCLMPSTVMHLLLVCLYSNKGYSYFFEEVPCRITKIKMEFSILWKKNQYNKLFKKLSVLLLILLEEV